MNNNDGRVDGRVPNFEKFPGASAETAGERVIPEGQDFEKAFAAGDVPEFAGNRFGQANPENLYYGEAKDDEGEAGEEFDAGIADAAALVNYGLNAAARELGVEAVVQKIKGFDAGGRDDPIGDLFEYLGIDTPAEAENVREEGAAAATSEQEFREGVNAPTTKQSHEGAFKALDDMKELIAEVEGADPRYEELRAGARSAGKGYFDYAVSSFGVQGLTELFQVLAQQREMADADEPEAEDDESEVEDDESEAEDDESEAEDDERLNPEILQKN